VVSHRDYNELIKKQRIRRGECVECGKAKCSCTAKTADVDPNIRSSVDDAKPNGLDAQQPLIRNPYSTGTAGDPQAAMLFENGYQAAQSMGHMQLNQSGQQHIQSWLSRPRPWRDGFAQAARGMGCGSIASQLDAANKIARKNPMHMNLPLSINMKIASALGTLAGGLGGAALGAGFGDVAGHAIGMNTNTGVVHAPHIDTPPVEHVTVPNYSPLDPTSDHNMFDEMHNTMNKVDHDKAILRNSIEDRLHNLRQGNDDISNYANDLKFRSDDAMARLENGRTGEPIGMGIGGLGGGAAGAALGHNLTKNRSIGIPKLATAYFERLSR
jgi:hypothetical protein